MATDAGSRAARGAAPAGAWGPWVLAAVASLPLLAFAGVALARIRSPFELEWIEGGMREVVRRVLNGAPLYTAPSIAHVPFLYPPLYFHAAAAMARLAGEGFVALRLTSLAATLASLACIACLANRGGAARWPGGVGAGLFAATYARSGGWMDLGHVDALSLALALAAFVAYLAIRGAVLRGIVAGLLFSLAVFTKQSASIIVAPFIVLTVMNDRRAGVALVATLLVCVGLGTLWLDRASDGWFTFYTIAIPRAHPFDPAGWSFWWRDLLMALPIALAFALVDARDCVRVIRASASGGAGSRPDGDALRTAVATLGLGVGGLFAAAIGRLHEGGAENVLMPVHAALAVLGARGLAALSGARRSNARVPAPGATVVAPSRVTFPTPAVAYLLALAQFAVLAYNPLRFVPSRADMRAGAAVVETLRGLPGDVWVPAHGYLSRLAGREPHAHLMAVIDVLRAEPGLSGTNKAAAARLQDEIAGAFAAHRFGALVLDDNGAFEPHLAGLYQPAQRLFAPADRSFMPVSGAPLRPVTVWMRVR